MIQLSPNLVPRSYRLTITEMYRNQTLLDLYIIPLGRGRSRYETSCLLLMCSYGHWNLGLTRLQSSFVVVGKGKEDGMELYHIDRSLCKQIKVTLKPNQKSGKYHKKPKRIQNRFDSCPKFRRPLVKFIRPEVWLRLP